MAGEKNKLLDWSSIDTVLLDMDGTLLDRHFDNNFFEEALPQRYADQQGLDLEQARKELLARYRAVEGTLDWADLQYWSRTLHLDVVALTKELDGMIGFLPDAEAFLQWLEESKKDMTIVTNAHPLNIAIKTTKTNLCQYIPRIISAFDVGSLKMHAQFWKGCQEKLGFDPVRTLYIDDDEGCLAAAQEFGIRYVLHRSKSSSQLPPESTGTFPAIESFSFLMGGTA